MAIHLPFSPVSPTRERSSRAVRAGGRQRVAGFLAALLFEALIVLALLTIGSRALEEPSEPTVPMQSFDLLEPASEAEARPAQPREARPSEQRPVTVQTPTDQSPAPATVTPQPVPIRPVPDPILPIIPMTRKDMTASDLARRPAGPPAPAARVAGPAAPPGAPDTQVVEGSGPNGERLYAASWYREPSEGELRGYLSTAQGPGWATIACRTVPDYRIEDCVAVGEYPQGSQIARAALAAAWQFRVRPPRIGGQSQVGEWVRIRIEYGTRRRNSWEKVQG